MESRGALDYGNWYSAKHGSDGRRTNSSRNVVFGVAGLMLNNGHLKSPAWMQQCQRYHTIPRDVTVDEKTGLLQIRPIPEIATLRLAQPRKLTGMLNDHAYLAGRKIVTCVEPMSIRQVHLACFLRIEVALTQANCVSSPFSVASRELH